MLTLPPVLTHAEARSGLADLRQALRASTGDEVVADAGKLERFDSSALAVLLACRREALMLNRSFAVRRCPPKLRRLAGLYGVESLLGWVD